MENNWIKSEDQDPPRNRKILGYTVDTARDPEIVCYKDKSWWSYVKRMSVPLPKYWQELPDVHKLILDTNRELKYSVEADIKDCDLEIEFYKRETELHNQRARRSEQTEKTHKDKKAFLQRYLRDFCSEV